MPGAVSFIQGARASTDTVGAGVMGAARAGRRTLIAIATAGLVLTAIVAATSITGWDQAHPWSAVVPRVGGVILFFAVGLWCLARRPYDRFGWLIVVLSVAYSLTMLNGSANSTLYSIGRAALPFSEVAVAYTVLAFPSGRLTRRRDQLLVAGYGVGVVALWLPSILLGERFTVGGVLVECANACPANALAVRDAAGPAKALSNCLYLIQFAVMVGVVASLAARYRSSRPVLRRSLAPVTFTAAMRAGSVAGYIVSRAVAPESAVTQVLGWAAALVIIALPLSFVVGVLRARLFSISVLHTLIVELNSAVSPLEFREALSRAVGDPDLQLVTPTPEGDLLDLTGHPLPRPAPGGSQVVTTIDANGHGLAILHIHGAAEGPGGFSTVRQRLRSRWNRTCRGGACRC